MTNCTYVKEYVRIISIVKYQTCGGVGVVAEAEKLVRTTSWFPCPRPPRPPAMIMIITTITMTKITITTITMSIITMKTIITIIITIMIMIIHDYLHGCRWSTSTMRRVGS